MYTDDKNAQVVLALLKKYGIKKIVVSPGTTNVPISRSVQIDPWFEVYSIVDERSAAYFAGGLAYESGEPVVISCTGATASRNYLPGLTEAYYRNLPVIALTSQHHTSDIGNLVPQVTDRTVSQNDVKKVAVHLPVVKDDEDYERCVISVNKALIAAITRGGGPVHINLPVSGYSFTTPKLPDVRKIEYINSETIDGYAGDYSKYLNGKKVAVFIGAHRKFNKGLMSNLERFATKYGAAVIVDHTSGYAGKNSILLAQISDLKQSLNRPDLVIDMGSITGEYSASWLNGVEAWRISEDGEVHDRFRNQTKLFDCSEEKFFSVLENTSPKLKKNYYAELAREVEDFTIPELPLSNTLISYELSRRLPENINLHMSILNSLRNMNFFPLNGSIDSTCNVGGFGIDGPLSTLIGQSVADRSKLTFGLVGDLSAFYDMNALGIRHIRNNIRILLVNNDGGVEFRLNKSLEPQWSDDTNEFISARGHNGSMKAWAESMGFHYMSADTTEVFLDQVDDFCTPDVDRYDKPVLFEVFTSIPDEQYSISAMHSENPPIEQTYVEAASIGLANRSIRQKVKGKLKIILPSTAKKLYRKVRPRD